MMNRVALGALVAALTVCADTPAQAGPVSATPDARYAAAVAMVAHAPHTRAQGEAAMANEHSVYFVYFDDEKRYTDGLAHLPGINNINFLELTQGAASWQETAVNEAFKYCDRASAMLSLQVARVYLADYHAGSPKMSSPDEWVVPGRAEATKRSLNLKNLCA